MPDSIRSDEQNGVPHIWVSEYGIQPAFIDDVKPKGWRRLVARECEEPSRQGDTFGKTLIMVWGRAKPTSSFMIGRLSQPASSLEADYHWLPTDKTPPSPAQSTRSRNPSVSQGERAFTRSPTMCLLEGV